MEPYLQAALKLQRYLSDMHWNGSALLGPDVGIRFNSRIGRFLKSYLPRGIDWKDSYYYVQAQGYWILANWRLFFKTGEAAYCEIALRAAEHMLERQRPDGAWDYPNPEWSGRVATVEGTWGSLGLVETYRHTKETRFLNAALRWHRFLMDEIGFDQVGDELSVNYFFGLPGARVPNISAFVLRFFAELADLTGDASYLQPCRGLVTFMSSAQTPTGELPYSIPGTLPGVKYREHFQCYQYNAFQCLDLMRYYQITGDPAITPVAARCVKFLEAGLAADGHSFFDCHNRYREVTYNTAALGTAFAVAGQLGFGDHHKLAERAFSWLLRVQQPNGAFLSSRGDYRCLSDRRFYPRPLTIILFHFLVWLDCIQEHSNDR